MNDGDSVGMCPTGYECSMDFTLSGNHRLYERNIVYMTAHLCTLSKIEGNLS